MGISSKRNRGMRQKEQLPASCGEESDENAMGYPSGLSTGGKEGHY